MRFLLVSFLLIHFLLAASAQEAIYKEGIDQYSAGKFSEAVATFSSYIENGTRDKKLDDEMFFARGMAHYKSGSFPKAISDFKKTLTLDKKNAGRLYWLIAKCQAMLGENYHAIEFYTEALPFILDPKKQAQLLFERANAYKQIQQKDLSESDLKKALMLNPDHFLAQESMAEIASTNNASTKKIPDASGVKRIALIIGNSKYDASIGPLKAPVNDAIAMYNELKKLKFETVVRLNLTAAEITKAIRAFHVSLKKSSPSNTIGFFYYAGHGIQVGGENYILPVDVIIEDPADVERLCIPLDAVRDAMQYSNVTKNVIILDACHHNTFTGTYQSIQKGLAPPNPAVGLLTGYAAAPGSLTEDGAATHGLYTQELIKVLRIPGLNIDQFFKKLRENVLSQSRGRQHAWNTPGLIADFYLNK